MPKDFLEYLSSIANVAGILTAVIAFGFYFRTVRKNYYLNDILGDYKIFSNLKDQEKSTALFQIEITFVSQTGWFFGVLKYSEVFKDAHSRSGGVANVFGKINYRKYRILFGFILRIFKWKKYNPLQVSDLSAFHGKFYLLSRNDLDLSKRNWRDMIIQEYSIIHYKDAHRFKLHNPKFSETYLQLPNELVLVNINKIPDPILDHKISF